MTKEIVQVIGNGDPGGGTTAVLTLATLLRGAGHRPLIVSQHDSYLLREAKLQGIAVHGMDFSSRGGAIGNCRALASFIRQRRPAVVHAHGNRAGLPVALAMKMLGRADRPRFVYTVHGFHFLTKTGGAYHLARMAEKFAIAEADWTNFVSDGDAQIARSRRLLANPASTSIIHNAVLAEDFPARADAPAEPGIAFIGRLTYQKNPLILADIAAALRPLAPQMHVIGGGEMDVELRDRVSAMQLSDQFVFHGQQHRTSALQIAAACTLLLLPSRWEGHPITVIEAMHMGLPVIASDISGTREIVVQDDTGFLVHADAASDYAAAIRQVLTEPGLAQRLGARGRDVANEKFSAQRMLQANLAAYRLASHGTAATTAPCLA
ncbi:glycosyltransferase [Massilia sp. LXY-6]|uniref:glycosyltransferase n=1 Tax=Massilia sp. LXY-6 TaxID=3379823 RepID=UPI003EE2A5F1